MSPQQRIARLEELLGRVKARATEPGARLSFDAASPVVVAPSPAAPEVEVDFSPSPAAPEVEATAFEAPPTDVEVEAAGGMDVDVEVSAEVIEVEIDVDDEEALAAIAAAEAEGELAEVYADADGEMETEAEDDAHESTLVQTSATAPPPAAPSSAERTISVAPEAELEEVVDEPEVPRHTPPPQSGELATPPPQMPSAPPPSLEGHTLVGGWTEPGLLKGGAGAPVNVPSPVARPAPSPAPAPVARPAPSPAPAPVAIAAAAPAAEPAPLRAEATRAQIATGAKVASFEGTAPQFSPETFGDLLDASLGL